MRWRIRFPGTLTLLTLTALTVLPACEPAKPVSDQRGELEAIDQLHRRDEEASKRGDFETLRSIMSDDAVMMPPGQHWIRGAEALDENRRRMEAAMSDVEVTDYSLDFEEVVVAGDYAFEWGTIRGASRSKSAGPLAPVEMASYKVMRILKKNSEGQWQVHRAIWNGNPPE